jgi:hypothetical protein
MKPIVIITITVLMFSGLIMNVPNVSAERETFLIDEECVNNILTLTVSGPEGVLENVSIHIYTDFGLRSHEGKVVTNEQGQAEIKFTDRTNVIKVIKANYNDSVQPISCVEDIEPNKISDNYDSKLIIQTNPDTFYGGEFWGFNDGSGIPIAIIVNGPLQDNGMIKLITKEIGSSTFLYDETYSVNSGFPKHLFNLNYPFKFDREYSFTAINGDSTNTINWIPLSSNPSQSANVPSTQNSRIIITGETHPIVPKGMMSKFQYKVEVMGSFEHNYKTGSKGGWLEICQDVACDSSDNVFMVSDSSRIYEHELDLGQYWKSYGEGTKFVFDFKPKVVQVVFRFGDDISSLNVIPNWTDVQDDFTVSESALAKISTKSVKVMRYMEAGMDNRWFTTIQVCSGPLDLQKPTIIISSDIESTQYTLNKSINKLSCAREEFQVKAMNPESIQVGLERLDVVTDSSEMDVMKAEIAELREMLEKKESKPKVPTWIKNNVQWWADGQVDDETFVSGIGFMVKEKIIDIPTVPESASNESEQKIPDWIRNNAIWWSEGIISEDDFINGIEFLVQKGIVRVP